mgnify:CR=1 FL=1
MIHTRYKIMIVVTVTIVSMIMLAIYLFIFDGRLFNIPIKFINDPLAIEVNKQVYEPGEEVLGYFDFCKLRNLEGNARWNLIDGEQHFMPLKVGTTVKGCHQVWAVIGSIPTTITEDDHVHFEGILTYKVNFASDINIPLKTLDFEVKANNEN